MARKAETQNFPKGFYDNETIPNDDRSCYYFALDKSATATEIERVKLMSHLNRLLDKMEKNASNKLLAEMLEVNPSVISRVRRFRYHDLGQDILWRMITRALEITDGKKLNGKDVYVRVMFDLFNKNDSLSY